MTNQRTPSRFPAVLMGGPPHAGKSVLSHSLKQALSQRGIECYLLRAAPDGEGDWYLEAPPAVAETERRKGKFTPAWVDHMARDIAYRPLPFLVDVGGKPEPWQEKIFEQCTHAILLVKDAGSLAWWQKIVARNNLITMAILTSQLEGESIIEAERPVLRATITGLVRRQPVNSPVFEMLLQRVQALFDYAPNELFKIHSSQAPVDLVVDIPAMFRHLYPARAEIHWQPGDLREVLAYLPAADPLALYGRGPGWLYAAVARHIAPQPFYQFDARLGWIAAPVILSGDRAGLPLTLTARPTTGYLHLEFHLPDHYLIYKPQLTLPLPAVPTHEGVILDGRLPNWLFTGLTLYYRTAPWVALYAPHLNQAIIVASQTTTAALAVGQTVTVAGLGQP